MPIQSKHFLAPCLLTLLLSGPAFAFPAVTSFIFPLSLAQANIPAEDQAGSAATPQQATQTQPGKFIQSVGNRAIGVMSNKNLTPDQRNQKYREILSNAFDMRIIGRFVLGRAWNSATPDQQQRFLSLFQQLLLRTYGDRLNLYSGEALVVKSVRQESPKDSVVTSNVTHPHNAPPTEIDWRVRQEGDKLAIIDVIVEGISQSVTQRQEYASILQNNNGNINALLDKMQLKAQETQTGNTAQPSPAGIPR